MRNKFECLPSRVPIFSEASKHIKLYQQTTGIELLASAQVTFHSIPGSTLGYKIYIFVFGIL